MATSVIVTMSVTYLLYYTLPLWTMVVLILMKTGQMLSFRMIYELSAVKHWCWEFEVYANDGGIILGIREKRIFEIIAVGILMWICSFWSGKGPCLTPPPPLQRFGCVEGMYRQAWRISVHPTPTPAPPIHTLNRLIPVTKPLFHISMVKVSELWITHRLVGSCYWKFLCCFCNLVHIEKGDWLTTQCYCPLLLPIVSLRQSWDMPSYGKYLFKPWSPLGLLVSLWMM